MASQWIARATKSQTPESAKPIYVEYAPSGKALEFTNWATKVLELMSVKEFNAVSRRATHSIHIIVDDLTNGVIDQDTAIAQFNSVIGR